MIFTIMSVWDNGSGCAYYTKEKFLEEISVMIDDCIANGGSCFDVEVMTDASCYSIAQVNKSEELTQSGKTLDSNN
jgi:hypothetical protein